MNDYKIARLDQKSVYKSILTFLNSKGLDERKNKEGVWKGHLKIWLHSKWKTIFNELTSDEMLILLKSQLRIGAKGLLMLENSIKLHLLKIKYNKT